MPWEQPGTDAGRVCLVILPAVNSASECKSSHSCALATLASSVGKLSYLR